MSSGSLGNVMSRLAGLKNVSGRKKVVPGAEFLEDLESPEPDVAGTSTPSQNFPPYRINQPEADLGGELTPQSYDVRANSINPNGEQNPMQNSGFLSDLGASLASIFKPQESNYNNRRKDQPGYGLQKGVAQTPPIETAQVDLQEDLPPVTASQQESQPFAESLGSIADYFSPTKRAEATQYNKDLSQNAQLRSQGFDPGQVIQQRHEGFDQEVQRAMQDPWQYSVYGSAEEVGNNPALQAEFKQITGIDYEPQIAAQISEYEQAMKGVEDSLNGINDQLDQQADGVRQRILDNQSTDADKYYIGLALLMPLIIGGFFGAEAGLGALGGAAQGVGNVLSGRQKSIQADEESLSNILKQQGANNEKLGNLALDSAKLGPTLRNALPKQANEHILGMEGVEWDDPVTGKHMQGVQVLPGLVARSEFVNTPDGLKNVQKAATELADVKSYVDEISDITDTVAEIVSQLDDRNALSKIFTSAVSAKVPGSLAALTQDVMLDGRRVNAGVALEQQLGFLANAYGMAKEIGQLDRAAQNHIKKIIENPTNTLLSPEDSLNQILEVRKLAQRGLVKSASNKGFYPEFLVKDIEERNNKLFGGLNQGEQDKRLAQREQQALQGETRYVQ
jgi:hypothetical protein